MSSVINKKEVRFKGLALCPGIAIGPAYVQRQNQDDHVESYPILPEQVQSELQRLKKAIETSKLQVLALQKQMENDNAFEAAMILEAHMQILKDELIITELQKMIEQKLCNVEPLFRSFIQRYERQMSQLSNIIKEKLLDVRDVSERILRNLKSFSSPRASLAKKGILFSHSLTPSDVAEALNCQAMAFVAQHGNIASHAAIMARSRGVPYVSGVSLNLEEVAEADLCIVDGNLGEVILNPNSLTVADYAVVQQQNKKDKQCLEARNDAIAETFDGYQVKLSANVEEISDIELVHRYKGHGIGLFRSEYLCLAKQQFPSEEEQYQIYREVVQAARGLPVVIRTFDVGGDKLGDFLMLNESNPFLGCRAIRYMLRNPKIFREQLRAILRVSSEGPVKIIFPMVTCANEFLQAKEIVQEEMDSLRKSKIAFDEEIQIGSMIETPSAALTCDIFAKYCDFLSIGTNDLVQYSLAVDRNNPMMGHLYNPSHPGVLRLIRMVAVEANRNGIPVSVCGELAADPRYTALLLGLGIHELSCPARFMPLVKSAIRKTSIVAATQFAAEIQQISTHQKVQEKLNEEYAKSILEIGSLG